MLHEIDFHGLSVEEARKRYFAELEEAHKNGFGGLLLIHGHHSGKAIRDSLRNTCSKQKNGGKIRAVVWGERLIPSLENSDVIEIFNSNPWLKRLSLPNFKWGRENPSITLVLLHETRTNTDVS